MVGLSNVFDTAGDLDSAWAAGAAVAATLWGDLPTVGYDTQLPDVSGGTPACASCQK